jgi:hypothetical protein
MKGILTLFLVTTLAAVCFSAAVAADGASGFGWQSSNSVEGISFKRQLGNGLALQGTVGHVSLSIDEPTIEYDGHEDDLDMTLKASAWNLGARALWTIREEANLDVYVGGGPSLYLLSAEADLDGTSADVTGRGFGLHAVTGVEYRFQGLPNLGFSTEVGVGYIWLNKLDADMDGDDVTISPNTSMRSFFLGGGIHYYF